MGHQLRAVREVTGIDSSGCVWESTRKLPSWDPPPAAFQFQQVPICGLEQVSSAKSSHTDHSHCLVHVRPLFPRQLHACSAPCAPPEAVARTLRGKQESSWETFKHMHDGATARRGSRAIIQ